jgi:hypothetical protein
MRGQEKATSRKHEAESPSSEHPAPPSGHATDAECCAVCAMPALVWRKCKLICENCGSVNKSCADL